MLHRLLLLPENLKVLIACFIEKLSKRIFKAGWQRMFNWGGGGGGL